MSRPPRPHYDITTAAPRVRDSQLDYLPLEYADLLEQTQDLAAEDLGQSVDATEGNLTGTLFELAALVGHVLAVYQDRYAGEAFLRTANARSSLVRHARRLAYTLDVGLSATGHVALEVKAGLTGTVDAGLALASARVGAVPPQTFETLAPLAVDATLNEVLPADATRPVRLPVGAQRLWVEGVGHGLARGDLLCLVGPTVWQALIVESAVEDRAAQRTQIALATPLSAPLDFTPTTGNVPAAPEDDEQALRLLIDPAIRAHSFGWSADPGLYPQAQLRQATGAEPASFPRYWYDVDIQTATGPRGVRDTDHYLARLVEEPLLGSYVAHEGGGQRLVSRVTGQERGTVGFRRKVEEEMATFTVEVSPNDDGDGFRTSTVPVTPSPTQVLETQLSATVSALEVVDHAGAIRARASQGLPLTWLAGFRGALRVASREPNATPVGDTLDLPGRLTQLTPGRRVIFSNLSGSQTQVVQLTRVQLLEEEARTRVSYQPLAPPPPGGFRLDDLKVLGNVAQVVHGRTQREVLGDSDGVTPFQRFALRMSPVSMLPEADGAVPQLALRVHDVAWQRVRDFFASGPEDRHYRLEIDAQQRAWVVFGDGMRGAIPQAGTRNISAVYKVGLGPEGNVAPYGVTRIRSPQPLLDRGFNPGAIAGGTAMADLEDVRSQAARYIRTFDRAVSVRDHADLALLYPGVVRSAARWDPLAEAIVLVAATADGGMPPPELGAFLDQRRDTQVTLRVVGPTPRPIALTLRVETDPAFLFENIRLGIQAALVGGGARPGLFTFAGRALGQPAYLSEVQAAVEQVEGVLGLTVTRFASREQVEVFDVIQARAEQWLSLSAQDLAIDKGEP